MGPDSAAVLLLAALLATHLLMLALGVVVAHLWGQS